MSTKKRYYKGIEDLQQTPEFVKSKENEFPEELPINDVYGVAEKSDTMSANRRDFLKIMGFSVGAVALASCEAPVRKAIPYLVKPEEVTPGVANWYASTYYDGYDFCDILVKTREGRPIKIEGNPKSCVTNGGTNARVQASVLSLYDSQRFRKPLVGGKEVEWSELDALVSGKLNSIKGFGGTVCLLSPTIISPSTKALIAAYALANPGFKHVEYDVIAYDALKAATFAVFGKNAIPCLQLNKAKLVVSFGADFLGNWLNPIGQTAQYTEARRPEREQGMLQHVQLEANMSLTGSNADQRISMRPSEMNTCLVELYNAIAAKAGAETYSVKDSAYAKDIKDLALNLWNNKKAALLVYGGNDFQAQLLTAKINALLEAWGNTISSEMDCLTKNGKESSFAQLVEDMKGGKVNALLMYQVNPVYTAPAYDFEAALKKVEFSLSICAAPDETSAMVSAVAPDHHFLEYWDDAQACTGCLSLSQPVISPVFGSRQFQDSFLKWSGLGDNYLSWIQKYWETNYFPAQTKYSSFHEFWSYSLQEGVHCTTQRDVVAPVELAPVLSLADCCKALCSSTNANGFELVLFESIGQGIGMQASNPWLLEFPDPVTKCSWDNYVTMSPKQMKEMGFNVIQGQEQLADMVNVSVNGKSLQLPVIAQPGQKYGTIGIPLGFGRSSSSRSGEVVGKNAFALASISKTGNLQLNLSDVSVAGSGEKYHLATMQTHHTMMGREIVKETSLAAFKKDPSSGNEPLAIAFKSGHHVEERNAEGLDLWEKFHNAGGQTFNMAIDLSACTGCGACVISCQAENNVPVVGKDEVRRGREMHWMRIDRYYSSDEKEGDLGKMEIPSENPEVVYQPVMCQHCAHAPCETVCPVIATSHSLDGLNQMTYNRCVGTRYCANNCPYKVRRFNWFNYADNEKFDFNMNDPWGKMVLNPDVVVRSRGVMEKCSMCVQRIQEGKLMAKRDSRSLLDGEIQTACSQSCPAKAITFGNVEAPDSAVATRLKSKRAYYLLEEVGVRPNVFYMTKVRNNPQV